MFNLWWLKITCGLDYRVDGLENIPDYPVIILSNHQSTWETLAIQKIFPPMVWVLKRELMYLPVFGWGMAILKPIAINRSSGKKAIDQLLEQGKARLAEGINVVVFPQGTRTAPGSKTKYKIGGAMLAAKTNTPVLPVAHNAGHFWPRKGFRKKRGCIHMVIGKPIPVTGMSAAEINKVTQDWIETRAAELGKSADIID
jgi:1-acyl-sn-glycerol-3-phosphate acyltransferase